MNRVDSTDHVDEEFLTEILVLLDDGAPDGLVRAVDLFRSAISERVLDIGTALDEGRFVDAAKASHSLRGSAGAFGARRLSSLSEQLESECNLSRDAPAGMLLDEMKDEFELFQGILTTRLTEVAGRRGLQD